MDKAQKQTGINTICFCIAINTRHGTGGRTRTGTPLRAVDFESTTSTNSITPAYYPALLFQCLRLNLFGMTNARVFFYIIATKL